MYSRTRIKICGITNARDACAAARLGADALGFVFYEPSSRRVTVEQACAVASKLPPFITRVALFLDAEREQVSSVVRRLRPSVIQFHGVETPSFCESFDIPYIKAVAMGSLESPESSQSRYPGARALLLDSHDLGSAGGSGQSFDWSRIPANLDKPLVLAGGLRPDNVADAVRTVRPFAVDVSSSVESKPGIKDHTLMRNFIREVARGDNS